MKPAIILLLTLFINFKAFSAIDKARYISVEQMFANKALKVKLKSKGGYQGYCMQMYLENTRTDSCFVWVEAGRRLVSKDVKQQDIFLVKNLYVALAPKEKRNVDLFGFCCISHNASPKAGTVFFVGRMEKPDWQRVAKVIDAGDYDNYSIQAAVWAISNDHPVSAISRGEHNRNLTLLKTVADIKHEEIPWYNTAYQPADNRVFSNLPSHIYADISYRMGYYGEISIVVLDHNGILQTTMLEEVHKDEGEHTYYMDLDVKGWKDGTYYLQVVQDGNKILERKKFKINTELSDNGWE